MTDQKFGRAYRLTINCNDGGPEILVYMPLTLQFNIERHVLAQLNTATLEVYNLPASARDRIFQARFLTGNKSVKLEVGYDTLYTIFEGTIMTAGSGRSGVDIVTRIEALDGMYDTVNTLTFISYNKGKTLGDIFKFLIGQFPTLTLGAVGNHTEKINRPVVFNGNTWDILKQYSRGLVFIDLGKVYVLKPNKTIKGQIPELNVSTGLLETPVLEENELVVTTLLEPRVGMQQSVDVKSLIQPQFNGQYAVNGVKHEGIISAAVSGQCRSTFRLFTGPQPFGSFVTVAQ